MKFYIVTPAYNSLKWLKSCVRSVADQAGAGVEVHHHIQDGNSKDGTQAWLESWQQEHADSSYYKLTFISKPDAGLYDAINKAWSVIPDEADVVAHLNSDEQYLPGTLARVSDRFSKAPTTDMLIASYIVVDSVFHYICHRRTVIPTKWMSRLTCQVITCACFYRVASFKSWGIRFDASYRSLADLVFFREIMAASPEIIRCPELFASIYVVTGSNVSWSEETTRDWERLYKELPDFMVRLRPWVVKLNNIQHRLFDVVHSSPRGFSIYPLEQEVRRPISIKLPTVKWKRRTEGEA